MPPRVELLVVGAGIVGAGVARLAARAGLSVTLLDRSDIAAGASSRSSRMIHGGLRYLEQGQFGLVREALHERRALVRMAPHLVRPARFLLPFFRGDRRPRWMVQAGLALYDALAGGANLEPHQVIGPGPARELFPALPAEGLEGAALYSDAVTDDARLALAVALDAIEHGAEVATYTEVTGARPAAGGVEVEARDRLTGEPRRWEARVLVNATGPWSDQVRARLLADGVARAGRVRAMDVWRAMAGRAQLPLLRPSRGSHVVMPGLPQPYGALYFARSDGRVLFLVPSAGFTLLGTTELEDPGDPGTELPAVQEVRYILDEARRALPGAGFEPQRALGLTTGVRPLARSGRTSLGAVPREHRIHVDGPVVSAVGGKYTTFRPMCADVMRVVMAQLGRPEARATDELAPLPGGEIAGGASGFERFARDELARLAPSFPTAADELPRLIRAHGTRAAHVLERDPEGAKPIAPGVPLLAAELRYAVEVERARTLEDVMRRRTSLWLSGDFGRPAAAVVAQRMAELLGWSSDRTRDELARWWRFSSGEEHVLRTAAETV